MRMQNFNSSNNLWVELEKISKLQFKAPCIRGKNNYSHKTVNKRKRDLNYLVEHAQNLFIVIFTLIIYHMENIK